jgi:hypothetical protein
MDLSLIAAIILLAFEAVYNAVEFFGVYRARKDKAKFIEAHSQIGEGSELVAFVLAGILLFLSDFNVILVGIVIALGIYHVAGTIPNKDTLSKMPYDTIKKLSLLVMTMCAIEVVFSIYVITAVIPLL